MVCEQVNFESKILILKSFPEYFFQSKQTAAPFFYSFAFKSCNRHVFVASRN